jgi:hypothetical protein
VVGWVASGRGQMVEWVKEGGGGTGHANQTPEAARAFLKSQCPIEGQFTVEGKGLATDIKRALV